MFLLCWTFPPRVAAQAVCRVVHPAFAFICAGVYINQIFWGKVHYLLLATSVWFPSCLNECLVSNY